MSLRSLQTAAMFTLTLLSASVAVAEQVELQYSSEITLTSLTDTLYQRHPAQNKHQIIQQQINANDALAAATFSEALSLELRHQNDVIGSSDGLQEWEGNLSMPLWLSGEKQQQQLLSDTLSAEGSVYSQQLRLEASAQVRELIWNVVLADTEVKQALQAWKTAQKLEQDVIERVKAGELAQTEGLLATTNTLEMHSAYLEKNAALAIAVQTYRHLTGETHLPNHYAETLSESVQHVQDSLTVSAQHPSLLMLNQQISMLHAQQDLAQYQGAEHPNLSLGVRRERGDNNENFNNSIGVGISFALDDKVYRKPAVAEAAANLADAEIARQTLERQLNLELLAVLHELNTKQQQLVISKQHHQTTQDYAAMQLRAFELGEIDLMNMLRSQSLANASQNKMQTLEIEIKRLTAQVNQAFGIIL